MRRMGTASDDEIAKFKTLLRVVDECPESVADLVRENPGILEVVNHAAETALHWLAVENDVEGIRLLHKHGAQLPLFALIHAIQGGKVESVDLLLELGAEPEKYNLYKILDNPIFGLTESKMEALKACFQKHGYAP